MRAGKERRRMWFRSFTMRAAMLIWVVLGVGCGDDGASRDGAEYGGNGTSTPLYVVSTRVTTSDGDSAGYLVTVPALDGRQFDLRAAFETTVGSVYADRSSGYLYHASSREPIITRWKLEKDGSLGEAIRLSFSNLGYDRISHTAASKFYAPDRAYFAQDAEVVIWNPQSMEIIGTIPLEVEDDGTLRPWFALFQRSDRLFVTVYWQGDFNADYTIFGDHTEIIEIDPSTNRIVERSTESRCNQLDTITSTPDGTAYFSSNAYNSPLRAMLGDGHGVDSCALRIVPPGKNFDEGFEVDLPGLARGRQAGDFAIVDDQTALLRVWHPELVSALDEDKSNWDDVSYENGHLWWSWMLGDAEAAPIPDQEPGAYGGEWYQVEDELLFLQAEGDFSESTLLRFDGEALVPALSGPGYIWGATRIR